MTIAIPRFPATNNEYDALRVLKELNNDDAVIIPHFESEKFLDRNIKGIFIPGGFSYGDYLRAGAIAAVSEIVDLIKQRNKEDSIPILGICNGFQILTESGILPGVLLQNTSTRFICDWIHLKPQNMSNILTKGLTNKIFRLPIAHFEGRYWIEKSELSKLYENDQVLFQYSDSLGNIKEELNPNGSIDNIAAISNIEQNVFGFMPHPERASRPELTSSDGLFILKNFIKLVNGGK